MKSLLCTILLLATAAFGAQPDEVRPLVISAENFLITAKVSGNLESLNKGLRGKPDHVVFDPSKGQFLRGSEHHEYGVGFDAELGIVTEAQPAWWMAEWDKPVEANLIVLSGVYPNQPQPNTAWKIELRRDGQWTVHEKGIGGWYDRGLNAWGGPAEKPVRFDALRVSLFSKDDKTPLKSIHFRGEAGLSWIVGRVAPIHAAVALPRTVRAGTPVELRANTLAGQVSSWKWNLGGGASADGQSIKHTFPEAGQREISLSFSDGTHTLTRRMMVTVASPIEAQITPLTAPVMVGQAAPFQAKARFGQPTTWAWDFGDGTTATGQNTQHNYAKPGIYKVRLTASDGKHSDESLALVRAHTSQTLRLPQVLLDTDQKNEQDDQHYFGYALFSDLDVLGVNSIHHGGGQEPVNYAEILYVLDLAKKSGLPAHREPMIFRGANQRMVVPESGKWDDTLPIITDASEAILAAARGASPSNPAWIVPVGPGTNMASAILQAREEGLDLNGRIRIMWLGGSNDSIVREFNGNNDPWSMYVVAQSGIETWIMPAPVGARLSIDKRTEGHFYAENPLGEYLKRIVPNTKKALFDAACLSSIISQRMDLGWIKETEFVTVAGPQGDYRWTKANQPTSVRVIRQIDEKAMQRDLFETMKGNQTKMIPATGQ